MGDTVWHFRNLLIRNGLQEQYFIHQVPKTRCRGRRKQPTKLKGCPKFKIE